MDESSLKPLKLQLYNKPKSEEVLRRSDVKAFEYKLQWTPIIIYGVTAAVVTIITVVFYFTQGLDNYAAYLIFGLAVVAIAAFVLYCLYGQHITATALVGVSREALYTGTRDQLWKINWDLLDFEDFHFDQVKKFNGKLLITVAGQEIPLFMESNLVELDDLPALITSIVECTRPRTAPDALIEDEIIELEMKLEDLPRTNEMAERKDDKTD